MNSKDIIKIYQIQIIENDRENLEDREQMKDTLHIKGQRLSTLSWKFMQAKDNSVILLKYQKKKIC